MTEAPRHPLTLDGRDASNLRGDPITGDRYWSREFAQKEWDHMWTRIWHVAGRTAELAEAGDYVTHNFLKESVICVRVGSISLVSSSRAWPATAFTNSPAQM